MLRFIGRCLWGVVVFIAGAGHVQATAGNVHGNTIAPSNQSIDVQIQDINGNWLTIIVVVGGGNSQLVTTRMRDVQNAHPGKRVRAVVQGTNQVVDIW